MTQLSKTTDIISMLIFSHLFSPIFRSLLQHHINPDGFGKEQLWSLFLFIILVLVSLTLPIST